MSERKRRRDLKRRKKIGDTSKDHAAAAQARQPLDQLLGGRSRQLWRPCGDHWPTERIQAALDCWDMLPPPPTLSSSSESAASASFPAIVCRPRRRCYSQSRHDSEDTSSDRRGAVLARNLPTIPAPKTAATPPPSKDDENFATDKQPNSIVEKIKQRRRDLTGATVRITRGRYANCTGTITEKMDVHLLQLDTVPTPLAIQDVYVLRYSDSCKGDGFDNHGMTDTGAVRKESLHDVPTSIDDGDSEYIRNKYTGATVYVAPNSSAHCAYWGVQGTVLRVLDLGYWYIIDNPNVEMAFRASNFDVLKYSDEWGDYGDNHNDVEIIEISDDDDDDDGDGNKDACIPKVYKGKIRPGQQPSALGEEESSNIQHFIPIESRISNRSPEEAEQEEMRSEDEARIDASGKTETLCSEDTSTSTSPCVSENLDSVAENDGIVEKEKMGIDSPLIPLIGVHNTKMHNESVVNEEGKGDENHSIQGTVVIEKGQICTKHQSVSSSNDKVECSVESNKRISNDDPKDVARDKEGKESNTSRASDIIASGNSDNSAVDMTEATGQPSITIEYKNAASSTSTNIDEASTTRRSPSPIKRKKTEVYSVKIPPIESIELAARLSAFDSFLFLAHGQQRTRNHARDATKKDESDDAAVVMSDQGGEVVEDILTARSNKSDDVKGQSKTSSSPTVNNEQIKMDQAKDKSRTWRNDDRVHANDIAWRNVVSDLHRQHCASRNWPTVMALPGTEVLMDEKQPLRIIPLEERIVRVVPGSLAECAELSERLSAFDDYMFLLGK